MSCPSGETLARGKSYNITIAYAPTDLSTALSARPQQTECSYLTINYTMLGDYSSSDNPDFFLSIPSSLTLLDPAWSTCTPALYGAWDPPITLQHATALTGLADQSTPSPPAAPVGRSTPVYAPATTTTAINSPPTATPSVVSEPGTSRTPKHAKTNTAEPVDPAIVQNNHKSTALSSPSNKIHGASYVPDKNTDISDSSNISLGVTPSEEGKSDPGGPSRFFSVSRPPLTSEESLVQVPSGGTEIGAATDRTASVANIVAQDLSIESSAIIRDGSTYISLLPSTPSANIPLINGNSITRVPGGALVFASSTAVPENQATIFSHTVSVGFSDAVIHDSRYTVHTAEKAQLSRYTLVNGTVAPPDGNPNEVKIGDENISVDEPATTTSGAVVSQAPSELHIGSLVLPFPAGTNSRKAGLGGQDVNASQSGHRNESNGLNAVVFTGVASRFSQLYSISVVAFIMAMVAMAGLAL